MANESPAGVERTEPQIVCDPPLPSPTLYVQLQAWISHHDKPRDSIPPCAYINRPNIPDHSHPVSSGTPWVHKATGEVLEASVHRLEGCGNAAKWVLVAYGEAQGPCFINGYRGGKNRDGRQIQRYRIWNYTQEEDGCGWEQERSVFIPSEADMEVHLHNHSKTPTNAACETASAKPHDTFQASDSASTEQSAKHRHSIRLRYTKRVLEDENDLTSDTTSQPPRKKVKPAP